MGNLEVREGYLAERALGQLLLHRLAVEEGNAAVGLDQLLDDEQVADFHNVAEIAHVVVALLQHPLQYIPGAGALVAQDEVLPEQGAEGPGGRLGQGVGRRAHADIGLLGPDDVVVLALAEVALHHGEVQLAVIDHPQQNLGVFHQHVDIHAGIALHIGGQPLRQQVFPDGQGGPEADGAPPQAQILHIPFQLLLVVEHAQRGIAQQLPLLGQREALVLIGEQLDAVVALEILDMLGHRRLGDVQLLRRPRVVPVAAHRQKGIHPKIKHRSFPPFPQYTPRKAGGKGAILRAAPPAPADASPCRP